MKKYVLLFILIIPMNLFAQTSSLPQTIRIYYMRNDPWGWVSDMSYPAYRLIQDYPSPIIDKEEKDIVPLIPTIDSTRLSNRRPDKHMFLSDSRIVVLLDYSAKVDTIALSSAPHLDIRFNDELYFIDENYYNTVVKYIATKDKTFRKWYQRHYHKGKWYFMYRDHRKGL